MCKNVRNGQMVELSYCAVMVSISLLTRELRELKYATVTFTSPKFNQLLLKHMWAMCENLKKIHQYVFELYCSQTN